METSIETGLQSVKMKRRITISWMPIIFLIPSLVSFVLFKYYPLFKMIYISFFDYEIGNPPGTFVGLNNYIEFLSSPSFWRSIEITFVFALLYLLMTFWVPIVQALLA